MVWGCKGYVLHYLFKQGVQTTGSDVLGALVDLKGILSNAFDRALVDF